MPPVLSVSRSMRFRAGLLAGSVALAIILAGRALSGRPGFLEAVSDGFIRFVPLNLFDAAVTTLGPLAKGSLYAGICLAVPLAGGLAALLFGPDLLRSGRARAGVLIALFALALAELLVLPLFGAGFGGTNLRSDPVALHVPLALAAAAYSAMLVALPILVGSLSAPPTGSGKLVEPEVDRAGGMPRRTVLRRSLGMLGLAAFGGSALAVLDGLLRASRPLNGGGPQAGSAAAADRFGPTPALTPVNDFYRIDKNLIPPSVDGATWRLRVDGLVDRPRQWTLDELRALPSRSAYRTLECISFQVEQGDHLIGNQLWRGVPITDLVREAGAQASATHILWEAADGYTESLPLEVAMDEDSWIVYEMGDAPLTAEHGYPARVFIAGRFGMKQPKWLTRMQLADHDELGYWEQRSWDREARVVTMSRIDRPRAGDSFRAGEPFTVSGVAFSGDRGIQTVELSPDDGATWLVAELQDISEPPLGPLTWVRWTVPVTIAEPGTRRLVVRATDGAGATQSGESRPPLPSGATGWHAARVTAVAM